MDWAILIFEILLAVAVFLIGLFVKNYLPYTWMKKVRIQQLKEDIEEITRKTEEVQQEFREGFELFSNDVKFKYIQSSKEIIARKKKSIKHLSGRD